MPDMAVPLVFEHFRRLAEEVGLTVESEPPGCAGHRVARVMNNGGELRLIWQSEREQLVLQISHGPPSGVDVFWLELSATSCPDGLLAEDELSGERLGGAMEYGLELMTQ